MDSTSSVFGSRMKVLLVLLIFSRTTLAAFGFKLDGTLEKAAISKAYFEGDFQRILPPLEAWRSSRANKTREDSIFVYKYLSVIYAADSSTRNKAESYMFQLLKLMPTIELVDMYISDNIEAIFKDVQEKFLKQQQYLRNHDELGQVRQDSASDTSGMSSKSVLLSTHTSNSWLWWAMGGIGVAAAMTGSYFIFHEDSQSPSKKSFKP